MLLKKTGISAHIIISFSLLFLCAAFAMAAAGIYASQKLSRQLLASQSGLVLKTLIGAEEYARSEDGQTLDTADMAKILRWHFLVGKQVPPEMENLAPGLHIFPTEKNFVLLEEKNNIPYVLTGSTELLVSFQREIEILVITCGAAAFVLAIMLLIFLQWRIAKPLARMADTLAASRHARSNVSFPDTISRREDEIGVLADAIVAFQKQATDAVAREKFFADSTSHELRNPLAILQGCLEILEADRETAARQSKVLERMKRTLKSITATASALLCLARSERRQPEVLRLDLLTRDILAEFFGDKGVGVSSGVVFGNGIALANLAACEIAVHKDLYNMVLRNLLENAIKHSPDKEVFIVLDKDCLSVRNPGKFARDPASGGFGLEIAARACQKMNWKLCRQPDENETIFKMIFSA